MFDLESTNYTFRASSVSVGLLIKYLYNVVQLHHACRDQAVNNRPFVIAVELPPPNAEAQSMVMEMIACS